MARAVDQPDVAFTAVLALQVTLAAGLLLPMTLALGAAFPLAVGATARRTDTISSDVAVIYTANTCGAIAGALLASFVLVPAPRSPADGARRRRARGRRRMPAAAGHPRNRHHTARRRRRRDSRGWRRLDRARLESQADLGRSLQVRALPSSAGPADRPGGRRHSVLRGGRVGNRIGPEFRGQGRAGHRRQGRRLERGRHADPEPAGAPAATVASRRHRRRHHRAGKRRHARRRAAASDRARRRAGDFRRGSGGIGVLRGGESRGSR